MTGLWIPGFLAGALFIMFFSWWLSIKEKRYHGIYRFFAFESILLLILLNARVWFKNPFSVLQLISWLLLTASLFVAIYAFYLIKSVGKPKGKFENTTKLVVTGLYKYIRHPMYLSLLLFGSGAYIKHIGYLTSVLMAVIVVALYLTAITEEGEMIRKFKGQYRNYMKKMRMFIPYLY